MFGSSMEENRSCVASRTRGPRRSRSPSLVPYRREGPRAPSSGSRWENSSLPCRKSTHTPKRLDGLLDGSVPAHGRWRPSSPLRKRLDGARRGRSGRETYRNVPAGICRRLGTGGALEHLTGYTHHSAVSAKICAQIKPVDPGLPFGVESNGPVEFGLGTAGTVPRRSGTNQRSQSA